MEFYYENDLGFMFDEYDDLFGYPDDYDDGDEFTQDFAQSDDLGSMGKYRNDTSASEARKGKDMQGIRWESLGMSREQYREMRIRKYRNYENTSHSPGQLEKVCKNVEKGSNFYDFHYNTRLVKSTITHFQVFMSTEKIHLLSRHSVSVAITDHMILQQFLVFNA